MQLPRLLWLALLLPLAAPADARPLVDATGRTVQVPDRIDRVMPAGQPAAVILFTLAPEKMVGWPHSPGAAARAFLDPGSNGLPELGQLVRDGKVQSEQIRAGRPDIILDYGSTSPRYAERATMVQEATGIPVLLLDGKLERTPEIFRLLGEVLEAEKRAADLANAAEHFIAITRQKADARRAAGPIRAYYARSADGLTTATSASSLGDVLRLIDLTNVADGAGAGELVHVTWDQIRGWNPDAIVTNNPEFWKAREKPEWAELRAVAQQRLYLAPALPFGWIDEPPSVNRLIGLLWAGHTLYSAVYPDDLRAEVREFYRLFYRVDLDDAQLAALSR
jgi:iron complex transport system substrate-binding protein